jgi:hypothetical protein
MYRLYVGLKADLPTCRSAFTPTSRELPQRAP